MSASLKPRAGTSCTPLQSTWDKRGLGSRTRGSALPRLVLSVGNLSDCAEKEEKEEIKMKDRMGALRVQMPTNSLVTF